MLKLDIEYPNPGLIRAGAEVVVLKCDAPKLDPGSTEKERFM